MMITVRPTGASAGGCGAVTTSAYPAVVDRRCHGRVDVMISP
jgi:hypothetical protein